MPKVNATEFAEKWGKRLKGATEDIRRGVEKITEAPTLKAAAKKTKMLANLTAAVNSGKWERGLKAVSLEDWKKTVIETGISRISGGVDKASSKMAVFAEKLLSYESGLQNEVKKMPDLTLEDSISRMATWVRGMSKFQK
jgi:hypothetical protein